MKVRLTESKLRQIVAESVKNVLCELATPEQYAHLAGQANGATNTFGGKVKGFFNPKWKARKERQEKLFADTAASSSVQGAKKFHNFNKTSTPGYVNGASINTNDSGDGDRFNIRRTHGTYYNGYSDWAKHKQDGQTYTPQEYRDANFSEYNVDPNDQMGLAYDAQRLNRAYNMGKNASTGEYKKDSKTIGGTSLYGTGRKSGMYKKLGEQN